MQGDSLWRLWNNVYNVVVTCWWNIQCISSRRINACSLCYIQKLLFYGKCYIACSQCSAPKHLTFNPIFPQKQKMFSRVVEDLVILPLLQEICKDKIRDLICWIFSLGSFIFQNIPLFHLKMYHLWYGVHVAGKKCMCSPLDN